MLGKQYFSHDTTLASMMEDDRWGSDARLATSAVERKEKEALLAERYETHT